MPTLQVLSNALGIIHIIDRLFDERTNRLAVSSRREPWVMI